jgi:hypothetical protein
MIRQVGELAFEYCSSLESICNPSSIEIIPESCFSNCETLVNIIVGSGSRLRSESVANLRSKWTVTMQ